MPNFAKRHYVAVADEFANAAIEIKKIANEPGRQTAHSVLFNLSRSFADRFSIDNPQFDRERFLKACGL